MPTKEKPTAPAALAIVVATAAVTLAIGVTAAGLGGYLVPSPGGPTPSAEVETVPTTLESAPTPELVSSSVVLVPVAPDSQLPPPVAAPTRPEPDARVVLANDPGEYDDDYHPEPQSYGHHRHEGDHDEDDRDDD